MSYTALDRPKPKHSFSGSHDSPDHLSEAVHKEELVAYNKEDPEDVTQTLAENPSPGLRNLWNQLLQGLRLRDNRGRVKSLNS